jgi:hypothetical protein
VTDRLSERFDWGDEVRIAPDVPARFRPAAAAYVVGMRISDDADEPGIESGIRLFMVEFRDGSDTEVPESFLLAATD